MDERNPLRMDNEETIDTTTELELNPDGSIKDKENIIFDDREYVVNIGPQHPANTRSSAFSCIAGRREYQKLDANCGYIPRH